MGILNESPIPADPEIVTSPLFSGAAAALQTAANSGFGRPAAHAPPPDSTPVAAHPADQVLHQLRRFHRPFHRVQVATFYKAQVRPYQLAGGAQPGLAHLA